MPDDELEIARAAEALGLLIPTEGQASLALEVASLRQAAERCRALLQPRDEPGLPLALQAGPPGR